MFQEQGQISEYGFSSEGKNYGQQGTVEGHVGKAEPPFEEGTAEEPAAKAQDYHGYPPFGHRQARIYKYHKSDEGKQHGGSRRGFPLGQIEDVSAQYEGHDDKHVGQSGRESPYKDVFQEMSAYAAGIFLEGQ